MYTFLQKNNGKRHLRFFVFNILLAFGMTLIEPLAALQANTPGIGLPLAGERLSLSPGFVPPLLRGITIHPDDPFRFDFVVKESGDVKNQGTCNET